MLGSAVEEIELEQAMNKALLERYPAFLESVVSADVKLKAYQLPLLQRKAQDVEVKVVLPQDKQLSNTMYATVIFIEDGIERDRLRCRFDIKVFSAVYYARRNLEKGELFTPADFYLKKTDILSYNTVLLDKNYDFTEKMVFSYIKADDPVPAWKLRRKAVVTVGQTVTVCFIYGNIKVKSQAKVLQQGYRGEQIRIRVVPSDKIYKAIVLDKDNVEVKL